MCRRLGPTVLGGKLCVGYPDGTPNEGGPPLTRLESDWSQGVLFAYWSRLAIYFILFIGVYDCLIMFC